MITQQKVETLKGINTASLSKSSLCPALHVYETL